MNSDSLNQGPFVEEMKSDSDTDMFWAVQPSLPVESLWQWQEIGGECR
jgi:hypothetical protein